MRLELTSEMMQLLRHRHPQAERIVLNMMMRTMSGWLAVCCIDSADHAVTFKEKHGKLTLQKDIPA